MAQTVKRLPTMRETWVQSLGQEDFLEKEMATDSSILAWKIPWMEEPGGLHSSWGLKESDMTERHSLTQVGFKKKVSGTVRQKIMNSKATKHRVSIFQI